MVKMMNSNSVWLKHYLTNAKISNSDTGKATADLHNPSDGCKARIVKTAQKLQSAGQDGSHVYVISDGSHSALAVFSTHALQKIDKHEREDMSWSLVFIKHYSLEFVPGTTEERSYFQIVIFHAQLFSRQSLFNSRTIPMNCHEEAEVRRRISGVWPDWRDQGTSGDLSWYSNITMSDLSEGLWSMSGPQSESLDSSERQIMPQVQHSSEPAETHESQEAKLSSISRQHKSPATQTAKPSDPDKMLESQECSVWMKKGKPVPQPVSVDEISSSQEEEFNAMLEWQTGYQPLVTRESSPEEESEKESAAGDASPDKPRPRREECMASSTAGSSVPMVGLTPVKVLLDHCSRPTASPAGLNHLHMDSVAMSKTHTNANSALSTPSSDSAHGSDKATSSISKAGKVLSPVRIPVVLVKDCCGTRSSPRITRLQTSAPCTAVRNLNMEMTKSPAKSTSKNLVKVQESLEKKNSRPASINKPDESGIVDSASHTKQQGTEDHPVIISSNSEGQGTEDHPVIISSNSEGQGSTEDQRSTDGHESAAGQGSSDGQGSADGLYTNQRPTGSQIGAISKHLGRSTAGQRPAEAHGSIDGEGSVSSEESDIQHLCTEKFRTENTSLTKQKTIVSRILDSPVKIVTRSRSPAKVTARPVDPDSPARNTRSFNSPAKMAVSSAARVRPDVSLILNTAAESPKARKSINVPTDVVQNFRKTSNRTFESPAAVSPRTRAKMKADSTQAVTRESPRTKGNADFKVKDTVGTGVTQTSSPKEKRTVTEAKTAVTVSNTRETAVGNPIGISQDGTTSVHRVDAATGMTQQPLMLPSQDSHACQVGQSLMLPYQDSHACQVGQSLMLPSQDSHACQVGESLMLPSQDSHACQVGESLMLPSQDSHACQVGQSLMLPSQDSHACQVGQSLMLPSQDSQSCQVSQSLMVGTQIDADDLVIMSQQDVHLQTSTDGQGKRDVEQMSQMQISENLQTSPNTKQTPDISEERQSNNVQCRSQEVEQQSAVGTMSLLSSEVEGSRCVMQEHETGRDQVPADADNTHQVSDSDKLTGSIVLGNTTREFMKELGQSTLFPSACLNELASSTTFATPNVPARQAGLSVTHKSDATERLNALGTSTQELLKQPGQSTVFASAQPSRDQKAGEESDKSSGSSVGFQHAQRFHTSDEEHTSSGSTDQLRRSNMQEKIELLVSEESEDREKCDSGVPHTHTEVGTHECGSDVPNAHTEVGTQEEWEGQEKCGSDVPHTQPFFMQSTQRDDVTPSQFYPPDFPLSPLSHTQQTMPDTHDKRTSVHFDNSNEKDSSDSSSKPMHSSEELISSNTTPQRSSEESENDSLTQQELLSSEQAVYMLQYEAHIGEVEESETHRESQNFEGNDNMETQDAVESPDSHLQPVSPAKAAHTEMHAATPHAPDTEVASAEPCSSTSHQVSPPNSPESQASMMTSPTQGSQMSNLDLTQYYVEFMKNKSLTPTSKPVLVKANKAKQRRLHPKQRGDVKSIISHEIHKDGVAQSSSNALFKTNPPIRKKTSKKGLAMKSTNVPEAVGSAVPKKRIRLLKPDNLMLLPEHIQQERIQLEKQQQEKEQENLKVPNQPVQSTNKKSKSRLSQTRKKPEVEYSDDDFYEPPSIRRSVKKLHHSGYKSKKLKPLTPKASRRSLYPDTSPGVTSDSSQMTSPANSVTAGVSQQCHNPDADDNTIASADAHLLQEWLCVLEKDGTAAHRVLAGIRLPSALLHSVCDYFR